MGTRGNGTRTLMPHDEAPLHVWHAWLCHGADPDGAQGEECPDGCYGDDCDPVRLALMRETTGDTER